MGQAINAWKRSAWRGKAAAWRRHAFPRPGGKEVSAMKLDGFFSKLKQFKMKVIDFQNTDLDRAGDLMLAAALAVAVTTLTLCCYYASKLGYTPFNTAIFNF